MIRNKPLVTFATCLLHVIAWGWLNTNDLIIGSKYAWHSLNFVCKVTLFPWIMLFFYENDERKHNSQPTGRCVIPLFPHSSPHTSFSVTYSVAFLRDRLSFLPQKSTSRSITLWQPSTLAVEREVRMVALLRTKPFASCNPSSAHGVHIWQRWWEQSFSVQLEKFEIIQINSL